jgi:hypothetical protein
MGTTCLANGQRDRQTDQLPHLIVKYQPVGKEAKGDPSKCFWTVTVMGPEQVTRPKKLQAI